MTDPRRIDRAARVVRAAPETVYRALIDPDAIAAWRPPAGMTGAFDGFDGREGGRYRMTLTYRDADSAPGKTTGDSDVVNGCFAELVRGRRVVELVDFETGDPAFAGTMRITTSLEPVPGGTEVAIACDHVPPGIDPADHQAGLASTLANLAAYVEAGHAPAAEARRSGGET